MDDVPAAEGGEVAGRAAADRDPAGYEALRGGVAFFPVSGHTVVVVSGPDAVRFVDSFTTAHLAGVPPGGTCEGMLLDGRGQVSALVHLFCSDGEVVIDAFPGRSFDIAAHLERYHIRERLAIEDASAEWSGCVLAGPGATEWLAARGGIAGTGPGDPRGLSTAPLPGGSDVRLIAMEGVWPGARLLQVRTGGAGALAACLAGLGVVRASEGAVETVRIEEGYPLPCDIPEHTLPQELGRDDRAISFSKGCYLGQETVARIDALGHVNRRLVRLACDGESAVGDVVVSLDQSGAAPDVVGRVSSVCWSPRLRSGLVLAMVSVRALSAGTALMVGGRPVRCVDRVRQGRDTGQSA